MSLVVTHQSPMAFVAQAQRGATLRLDGTVALGGDDAYLRPMEGVLASLASCSGVDVAMILGKQKQPVDSFQISVEAVRAAGVPAVFETIHLVFRLQGDVAENKAARAVALSVDKYCSVARMLAHSVAITYEVELNGTILAKPNSNASESE